MSDAFSRACILIERQRWADAEKLFRESLASDPEDHRALYLLAICVRMADGRDAEALQIIDQAIARSPETGDYHAMRAKILADLKRGKEAAASVAQALALDPSDADFYATKAYVHQQAAEWAATEEAARKALALDPDSVLAQNLLSSALTFQNRPDELAQNIDARLARDPNDSLTHNAAGWAALRSGDRRKAETHFLEALRLDASNESARLGLLDAFRSRSIIYRAHLSFSFFAASLAEKHRMFLFLGIYVIYQFAKNAAKLVSPVLVWLVVAAYLVFVLWSYIGRGIGTLLVLADPRARQALKRRERWEGVLVGGGAISGLVLLVAGLLVPGPGSTGLASIGALLAAMAVPWALCLSNDNKFGIRMYGALAGFVSLCALVVIAHMLLPVPTLLASKAFSSGLLVTVVCTWMAVFRVKYE